MMKRQRIESRAMRQAANGEACTVEIMGVCNGTPETTVLAHLPDESGGMSRTSDDISAVFACHACHDALDGRKTWPDGEATREWHMRRAMVRTWRRLVEMGIVSIKGVKA